ncbi:MAG: transcription elongation factor GreA [Solirubrobacteraceae bacterium]
MSDLGESNTPEGLTALKAEHEELEGPARREIASRIQRARELGDLKENAEYHQAKDDQAHLETKIQTLADRLRNAVVTEISTDGDEIGFGSRITLRDQDSGKEQQWTLVGAAEADVVAGKLSVEAPVAQAVMGRSVGDLVTVVTPRGQRHLEVIAIGG